VKFSIVIPAYNEEKLLGDSLEKIKESLAVLTENGHDWELIVCDNNSTDKTAEIAKTAGARVVFESVNQISRARNTGASVATGDWLVFIDADSYPAPGLMKELLENIRQRNVIGGGAMVYMKTTDFASSCCLFIWRRISRCLKWAAGSFLFCSANAFKELGGFTTELFASEEIEFSKRLKKLARKKQKKVVVLKSEILTSDRKLKIYGSREYLKLCWQLILNGKNTLKHREFLHIWYDGKR